MDEEHEKYTAVFVQRYKTTEPTCMFTSVCILVQRGAEHRMSGRFALVSRYTSHIISHSDTHFWPLFYWWGHTQQPHPQHLNNRIYTCAYTLKRMYTHTHCPTVDATGDTFRVFRLTAVQEQSLCLTVFPTAVDRVKNDQYSARLSFELPF